MSNQHDGPILSVLVASLNQKKYIKDFIEGWKSQSFQDFEIIVVDSFSSDGTAEDLLSYDKVQFYQKKCGSAEAYLYALTKANGKYLMIGSTSDFICSKFWAQRAIEKLESDIKISMVWSSGMHVDEEGIFQSLYTQSYLTKPPPAREDYLPFWAFNSYVPELCYCVVTSVYRKCVSSFLAPNISSLNFMPYFIVEFTKRGYLQEYIPDIVFAGRDHPGQLREINLDDDTNWASGAKSLQLQFLRTLLFTRKNFWFIDRYDKKVSQLSTIKKFKVLFFWAAYYFLKLIVRIPRAISNRIH